MAPTKNISLSTSLSTSPSSTEITHPLNVLTAVLRLCTTPPVPYPLIAHLLLSTFPTVIRALFHTHTATSQHRAEDAIETHLAAYLAAEFISTCTSDPVSRAWNEALQLEEENVKGVLKCMGLTEHFAVADEEIVKECAAQARWTGLGNWKAGSEPLGRVGGIGGFSSTSGHGSVGRFGWVGKEREEDEAKRAAGEQRMSRNRQGGRNAELLVGKEKGEEGERYVWY